MSFRKIVPLQNGVFAEEVTPVSVPQKKGKLTHFTMIYASKSLCQFIAIVELKAEHALLLKSKVQQTIYT